jgi:hypothetical protein
MRIDSRYLSCGMTGLRFGETGRDAGTEDMELTVIVVAEAIDREREQVSVNFAEGGSRAVRVRNPAQLDRVAVGDRAMIVYMREPAADEIERSAN